MQIGYAAATRIVLLLGLVVAIGARSQAAPILVEVRSDGALVQSWNSAALGCAPGGPGEVCSAISNQTAGDFNIRSLNLQLGTDSIFNASIAVDNTDTATHRLTVDIILTIPSTGGLPIVASGFLGGSITDGITPGDDDENVTISTVVGSALYTALLDGIFYDSLSDHLTSYSDPDSFTLPTPNNFGFPSPPSQPGPPVASTIAIRFDFTLTGRDQAGLQGSLLTEIVPEPSTAMLFGLGLVALATAGRRR